MALDDTNFALTVGTPTEANTTKVDFTATANSGILENGYLYRLYATKDCFISFIELGVDGQATTSGFPLLASGEYFYSTDDTKDGISAIRSTQDGSLYCTKMRARREYNR